jgi:hypothetical protein
MRALLLAISLVPYLYYGTKDNIFHFRGRHVTRLEHLLHLAIGLTLVIAIAQAFADNQAVFLAGLVLFLVAGSVDEYVFHRGLPEEESDLHAKEHLGLMIFVIVAMTTSWLERNQWQISNLLDTIR